MLLNAAAVITEPVYVPTCVAPIEPELAAFVPAVSFNLYQTAGVGPAAIAAAYAVALPLVGEVTAGPLACGKVEKVVMLGVALVAVPLGV